MLGDASFDFNYYNGKTHFSRECMMWKQNEKKENEKDEACYLKKIEDLKLSKAHWKDLVEEEDNSHGGNMEVWSTDFEDKEIR